MRFHVLSLFPRYFEGPFSESMLKRAQERGILTIELVDIRQFAEGKHRQVDDRPYGGGPGMVLMPGPVTKAIRSVKSQDSHVIYMSPRGKRLDAKIARRLAKHPSVVLVCGHYEGVDERVLGEVDEEISLGDFVLTNGCLAACAVVDAVSRFVPGVLGESRGAEQDSFEDHLLEHPAYTRPLDFEGAAVPEVLRSGNHEEVARFRYSESFSITGKCRRDLMMRHLESIWEVGKPLAPALEVADLGASRRFYRKLIGWNSSRASEGAARLEAEAEGILLVEQRQPQRVRLRLAGVSRLRQRQIAWRLTEHDVQHTSFRSDQDRQALEFTDLDGHHFLCVEA